MKQYKNYIFDLYGTLIDIETNENSPTLWKRMAELYSVYGADYKPKVLHTRYLEMVDEEEELLHERNGSDYPEIQLEKVFARLYKEAPHTHDSENSMTKVSTEVLTHSEWAAFIANAFRVISRKKCRCYKNTKKVLTTLRNNGCGVYLLSNAQHIFTMPEIEKEGLSEYFDGMFISSDVGFRKPDPSFMTLLLKLYHLKTEDCVMVGNDYDSDIGIAASVGMDSIFLNTFNLDDTEMTRRLTEMRKRVIKINPDAKKYSPVLTVKSGDIGEII